MQNHMFVLRQVTDTPITRLHEDILWSIFLENTETHNEKRLVTARCSSQVCQQWRTIMLKSSSIWGRAIDLNDLRKTTYDWFQEVISRAGNSSLWIIGPIGEPPPDFLLSFIDKKWDRIQRLNITGVCVNEDDRAQYWTTLFKKPAPILEEFVFHYSVGRSGGKWILPSPPFAATAPALKKLEFYRTAWSTFKFNIDMPASWVSKLRSFTLYQDCNITRLLEILAMTPLLEDLGLHGSFASIELQESNISLVDLPKLTSIRLGPPSWSLPDVVVFLERISPALGCLLSMSKPHVHDALIDLQYIKRAQVLLWQYVQNYFKLHHPSFITLSCDDHFLEVVGGNCISQSSSIRTGLSIWTCSNEHNYSLIYMLFTTPFLSNVVELDLRKWRTNLPFPISAFDSVTTLWIEYESLVSLLYHVDQGRDSMLLQLDVLKIGHQSLRVNSKYREPLDRFLRHRWATNRPISILDLSPSRGDIICDLDNLEDLTGLLVIWSLSPRRSRVTKKYVCGNGHPDILRFEKNYPDNKSIPHISFFAHPSPYTAVRQGWSGHI